MSLPQEVWGEVFSHLPNEDRSRIRASNSLWQDIPLDCNEDLVFGASTRYNKEEVIVSIEERRQMMFLVLQRYINDGLECELLFFDPTSLLLSQLKVVFHSQYDERRDEHIYYDVTYDLSTEKFDSVRNAVDYFGTIPADYGKYDPYTAKWITDLRLKVARCSNHIPLRAYVPTSNEFSGLYNMDSVYVLGIGVLTGILTLDDIVLDGQLVRFDDLVTRVENKYLNSDILDE